MICLTQLRILYINVLKYRATWKLYNDGWMWRTGTGGTDIEWPKPYATSALFSKAFSKYWMIKDE